MKVIDLLTKIAKGEKIPEKIKYEGDIYEYNKCDYQNYEGYETTNLISEVIFMNKQDLNEEIEIIEDTPKEDKNIEIIGNDYYHKHQDEINQIFQRKINEIIDKVNGDK